MFLKSTKDWKHAGRMFQLSVFFDINKYSCCNLPRYVIFFRLTWDKLFFYFKHKNTYEFLTGVWFGTSPSFVTFCLQSAHYNDWQISTGININTCININTWFPQSFIQFDRMFPPNSPRQMYIYSMSNLTQQTSVCCFPQWTVVMLVI